MSGCVKCYGRRNVFAEGGSSLLRKPSKALERLLRSSCGLRGAGDHGESLKRPVLAFVTQRHELDSLQLAMRQALRKAVCRVFAMQAFNWLLRSVTQACSIHDLLWFFVSCLTRPHDSAPDEEGDKENKEGKSASDQVHVR